ALPLQCPDTIFQTVTVITPKHLVKVDYHTTGSQHVWCPLLLPYSCCPPPPTNQPRGSRPEEGARGRVNAFPAPERHLYNCMHPLEICRTTTKPRPLQRTPIYVANKNPTACQSIVLI
ncbi:unnamed protein product, partial [Ectocarpus sp. 8 AP-2014]